MITRCLTGAVLLLAGLGPAAAQSALNGRSIVLDAGDTTRVNAPISLTFEGAAEEDEVILVTHTSTGKVYRGTLRNGELVFVPEGALPHTQHRFVVETKKDSVPPQVRLEKQENANAIDVFIDDAHFTTYHYKPDEKKPYLWPVYSEGHVTVTRDYPMGEKELSADHPHHRSMWTSYGDVNGADCWMEGDKAGWQISDEVSYGSGDAYGWIHARNTWTDAKKQPVLSEEREYRFYHSTPGARLFDVSVTFTATHGDVLFGDTKEGGIMSLRIRDVIAESAKNGGTMTLTDGRSGMAQCWGQPSPWCDYSGPIEGQGWHGVTIFDHPSNLRHPTRWHVRDYGLMGANCFGLSYFTNKRENGDYTLKNGESLTFRYRVYVHRGNVEQAKVADRYTDYAAPPKVAWFDLTGTTAAN
ncbi:MAG: hypothetical protein AMXMBFR4_04720 [Candidatus Hydrogenedentota bacterium]